MEEKCSEVKLHEEINRMSAEAQLSRSFVLRLAFESQMLSNTLKIDPDGPEIKIHNRVDNDPAPPFDFLYSSHMWFSSDVSPPTAEDLLGCGCIGFCDPGSTTCLCISKQRQLFELNIEEDSNEVWKPEAFMYDKEGRVSKLGCPIVECNDLCNCHDDCRNRVCHFIPQPIYLLST